MKVDKILSQIENLNPDRIKKYILDRPDEVFTVKELAKALKRSEGALKYHLNKLVREGVIGKFKVGNFVVYGHPDAIDKLVSRYEVR